MASHNTMKHAVCGLALLAALAAATDADAQTRRLPVRTEPIPDTESGRPATSAEKPTFKGRLLIFGPPELPLGAPPEHIKPAPKVEPVAEPKADPQQAPSAAPAPIVVPPPAPVATPKPVPATPPPAQIAIPAPTPAPPPAQVAVPAPAPTPPPVQIAVPAPAPTPPPVRIAAPAPTPTPLEPAVRETVVRSEPVRSEPARPAAPVAPPRQDVALAVPSSAPAAPPVAIDTKLIESIFFCLSPGLPQDWKRAWVEITDQGSGKEKNSRFLVSNIRDNIDDGEPLVPCNARELTGRIVGLNATLPPDRRAWTRALLVIDSDGEYELTYEYSK